MDYDYIIMPYCCAVGGSLTHLREGRRVPKVDESALSQWKPTTSQPGPENLEGEKPDTKAFRAQMKLMWVADKSTGGGVCPAIKA